jgi:hypothetical protein
LRFLKRYRITILILTVAVIFLLYFVWIAVQMNSARPLVNGYRYWRMPSSGVIIRLTEASVERIKKIGERGYRELPTVGPDVDGYRVYKNTIVGHVVKEVYPFEWGDQYGPPREQRPAGYFIIDVRNDIVYAGLTKQQWLDKLREFGVTSEPKLFKPSVFDKLLRRNRPSDVP